MTVVNEDESRASNIADLGAAPSKQSTRPHPLHSGKNAREGPERCGDTRLAGVHASGLVVHSGKLPGQIPRKRPRCMYLAGFG